VVRPRLTNPNEFLNRAVYHFVVARDLGDEYASEEIDRMIAEGLDDIERNDTVEGKEAFNQLRATVPNVAGSVCVCVKRFGLVRRVGFA